MQCDYFSASLPVIMNVAASDEIPRLKTESKLEGFLVNNCATVRTALTHIKGFSMQESAFSPHIIVCLADGKAANDEAA